MTRYSQSLTILGNVIASRKGDIVSALAVVGLFLILSSSLMYFFENSAQPKAFSSIPQTMWWAISTLSTVGYGDIYPITLIGKVLAGIVALLGIGLFALPAGMLAAGFAEEMRSRQERIIKCPHCGKDIHNH